MVAAQLPWSRAGQPLLRAAHRSLADASSPVGWGPPGCSVRWAICTPSGLTGSLSSGGPTGAAPAELAGGPGPSCQMALSGEALCREALRSFSRVVVSSTKGSSDFSARFSVQMVHPSRGN